MDRKFFSILIVHLILIVGSNHWVKAQSDACGTVLDLAQKNFESTITDSLTGLIEVNQSLNITLQIVNDENGQRGIGMPEINQALSELNQAFDKIKLSFVINNTIDIPNYHYNILQRGDQERDLITEYHAVNTINLYLVEELRDETALDICAFTYYPSASVNALFIRKDCLSGRQLTRQVGHFLNLYHTHETEFGAELVNGSNCSSAGDLVCDTPADPGLSEVVSDCKYTGSLTDTNGEYYLPTTRNYMSFTDDNCDCYFFSDQQYIRMLNCLVLFKSRLW